MTSESDPRVYFAAERTLLAWLRSGIGIMAFGFVVARFGLFLRMLRSGEEGIPVPSPMMSPWIGASLVLLGAIATTLGALRYRSFCKTIPVQDLPSPGAPLMPTLLSLGVAIIGGLLILQVVL